MNTLLGIEIVSAVATYACCCQQDSFILNARLSFGTNRPPPCKAATMHCFLKVWTDFVKTICSNTSFYERFHFEVRTRFKNLKSHSDEVDDIEQQGSRVQLLTMSETTFATMSRAFALQTGFRCLQSSIADDNSLPLSCNANSSSSAFLRKIIMAFTFTDSSPNLRLCMQGIAGNSCRAVLIWRKNLWMRVFPFWWRCFRTRVSRLKCSDQLSGWRRQPEIHIGCRSSFQECSRYFFALTCVKKCENSDTQAACRLLIAPAVRREGLPWKESWEL